VEIPDVDGREGLGRPPCPGELACDHPHRSLAIRQAHDGNLAIQDALVARCRHLVLSGQIDPKLHHFKHAAAPGEFTAMKFFVDQAGCRGHPLHVAGADAPTAPGGIPVFHFALVDDGHCLESAMRVFADSAALVRRRELHGAGVIEEQERTEDGSQVRVGKKRSNREAIAYPVTVDAALDAAQFLY